MNTPDKASAFVYVLAPLAAILASALALQGWRGSRAAAILHTPPRKIAPAHPLQDLSLTDDFQIIRDRALFYATRKFYAPALAIQPTTPSQLSNYQLLGTLLIPHKPGVAFLREGPAGQTTTVSPGDHLDGWTVKSIQIGKLVFSYGIQRVTLTTTIPMQSASAAQSVGIVRMPATPPAQRRANTAHTLQNSLRPSRRPHAPPDRTRGQ